MARLGFYVRRVSNASGYTTLSRSASQRLRIDCIDHVVQSDEFLRFPPSERPMAGRASRLYARGLAPFVLFRPKSIYLDPTPMCSAVIRGRLVSLRRACAAFVRLHFAITRNFKNLLVSEKEIVKRELTIAKTGRSPRFRAKKPLSGESISHDC